MLCYLGTNSWNKLSFWWIHLKGVNFQEKNCAVEGICQLTEYIDVLFSPTNLYIYYKLCKKEYSVTCTYVGVK